MPPDIKLCKILTADKIKQKSTKVDPSTKPSEALINTCWKMIKACLEDEGIGLAAPQIGVFKQVFVIKETENSFRVYFNPRYSVDVSSKTELGIEGCLSVPGKRLLVSRSTAICAEWLEFGAQGVLVPRTELLEGFKARVYQHEWDHLAGFSILDKVK